jgi:hypothetical protein
MREPVLHIFKHNVKTMYEILRRPYTKITYFSVVTYADNRKRAVKLNQDKSVCTLIMNTIILKINRQDTYLLISVLCI